MQIFILILAFFIAIVDWISVAKGWKRIEYFAKPAVMVILLIWVGLIGGFRGPMLWFVAGLLFSLAGDVFLMLPRESFIAGLISFLLAHICYLIGFNVYGLFFNTALILLAVVIIFTAIQLFARISAGLRSRGRSNLQIPVLVYSIVISMMLFSALTTLVRPNWRFSAAALASVGALLFYISDVLLAWNRFVSPLPGGRVVSMPAYHLGQLGIILGAAIQYVFT
jgi:uncharacterized membrane protein YhhN